MGPVQWAEAVGLRYLLTHNELSRKRGLSTFNQAMYTCAMYHLTEDYPPRQYQCPPGYHHAMCANDASWPCFPFH